MDPANPSDPPRSAAGPPEPRTAGRESTAPQAPRPLPPRPRIVIVRFTSLGDVVKATGLPRQIRARYPQAHLTMITAEAYLPLIADNPHLDRAIGFERKQGFAGLRRLARELRAEGVDLVVDIHKSPRSRLLARWLGAPGVDYSKRTLARWLLIRFGIDTYRRPRRKEQDFAAALAPYGIEDDGRGPEIFLDRLRNDPALRERFGAELERIDGWRRMGLPVIGVAPVAAWELKRWPIGAFRAFAEGFVRKTGGGVAVFGGPEDREARALAEGLGAHAISLVGRTTLLESAYFASLTDLTLANDTGMSHLTEAVGRDAIVLFGPTTEHLGYFPARPGSIVVQRDLPCRPCTRMGEGRCTHPLPKACLVGIAPEHVLGIVLARLAARQSDGTEPA